MLWAAEGPPRLTVLTEDWPPVSYMENGKPAGMAVEVVKEMLRRAKRSEQVEIVPWSRAYKLATESPNVVLFSLGRNAERERLFTLLGPLLLVKTELYQRRGAHWKDRLEQARQQAVVGTYRSTYAESSARQNGFQQFSLASTPERSARMLLAGRIDLWADSNLGSGTIIRKAGGTPADIERVMTLDVTELMIGFSRGSAVQNILALEQALREMKGDGSFQRIHRHWFPGEDPPAYVIRVGVGSR